MSGLIKSEFLKLKGMPFYTVLFGAGILMPLIGTVINAGTSVQNSWASFASQNLWVNVMIVWSTYILTLGNFMNIRERTERTLDILAVIPVGRIRLILSKLVVLLVFSISMAAVSYVGNLFFLTLRHSVGIGEFFTGLVNYICGGALLLGALLPVFAVTQALLLRYFGAFIVSTIYLAASFAGMWNKALASLLPVVNVLRFENTGYQIIYGYSFNVSVCSYVISAGVSLMILLMFGYKGVGIKG